MKMYNKRTDTHLISNRYWYVVCCSLKMKLTL